MKKIILITFLLLTLTSCFGEKKQDENKEEVKNNSVKIENKTKTGTILDEQDNIKVEKKDSDNIEITNNEDDKLDKFIKLLIKNPDSLKNIDCKKYTIPKIINYCIEKQNIYLKNIKKLKKENSNIILNKDNFDEEIKKFEEKTKKKGELILKQDCNEFKNDQVMKICNDIKKQVKINNNKNKKNLIINNKEKLVGKKFINVKENEVHIYIFNDEMDKVAKKMGCFDGLEKGYCIVDKKSFYKIKNKDALNFSVKENEVLIGVKNEFIYNKVKDFGCSDGLKKGYCIITKREFNKIFNK